MTYPKVKNVSLAFAPKRRNLPSRPVLDVGRVRQDDVVAGFTHLGNAEERLANRGHLERNVPGLPLSRLGEEALLAEVHDGLASRAQVALAGLGTGGLYHLHPREVGRGQDVFHCPVPYTPLPLPTTYSGQIPVGAVSLTTKTSHR